MFIIFKEKKFKMDIADLLEEGEVKETKKQTGVNFLSLIKNNNKKLFDSPIQVIYSSLIC